MKQRTFADISVGTQFKRRNFASHSGMPGILWFEKISESETEKNARVVSDDYKGRELCLDKDEPVFLY